MISQHRLVRTITSPATTSRFTAIEQCKSIAQRIGVAALLCAVALAAGPANARGATAGETLRQYLDARRSGDVQTARGLWVRKEVQRSRAMGTNYAPVEVRFDDYMLFSAAERERMASTMQMVVKDSVVEDEVAHFTVVVRASGSGEVHDTWRYLLQKTNGAWRVSLPLMYDTRGWTRREGRFVRVRSKKLVRFNQQALLTLDERIEEMFDLFGTPPASRLRLERVKLEYFLCENEDDVRSLLGASEREGYLPGTERIVTPQLAHLNAVTQALVNLTLRKAPPYGAAFIETGLGAAHGGLEDFSADVVLQRAAAHVLRDPKALEARLTGAAESDVLSDPSMAALWCAAVLDHVGPEKFMQMYRGLRGTKQQAAAFGLREAFEAGEAATGRRGDALLDLVRDYARSFEPTLRAGCEIWPEESRLFQPALRARDTEAGWELRGYETGEDYTFVIHPIQQGRPKWIQRMTDSLAVAHGQVPNPAPEEPETVRPAGDPTDFVLLLRPRDRTQADPFESPLFADQFISRPYVNEQFGLFISAEDVFLYDYRTGVLLAEHSSETARPDALVYYETEPGRLSFRLRKNVLPKQLLRFDIVAFPYTGE